MSNIKADSVQEIGKRLYAFNSKITNFLQNSGYGQEDARCIILKNISSLIAPPLMRASIIISIQNNVITEEKVKEIFGDYGGDLSDLLDYDMRIARIAYVTLFQFQVESLFSVILSELSAQRLPKGYYCKAKKLLEILNMNNDYKLDKLNALAFVRNCLHSNGIHSKDNKTFVIDGYVFKFVKGKSFENASWGEILYMTNSAFEVIKEILESDKVKQITHPLTHQYIPDNNDS